MQFNTSECELLTITRKRQPSVFAYSVDGSEIRRSTSHKYLGVTISSHFAHTDTINIPLCPLAVLSLLLCITSPTRRPLLRLSRRHWSNVWKMAQTSTKPCWTSGIHHVLRFNLPQTIRGQRYYFYYYFSKCGLQVKLFNSPPWVTILPKPMTFSTNKTDW